MHDAGSGHMQGWGSRLLSGSEHHCWLLNEESDSPCSTRQAFSGCPAPYAGALSTIALTAMHGQPLRGCCTAPCVQIRGTVLHSACSILLSSPFPRMM